MVRPTVKIRTLLAALLFATTPPANADTNIDAIFSPSGDSLKNRLINASLILQAERDGTTDAQELFAAARADYERLLAVLYGAGHFGGQISIALDGREAAAPARAPEPDGCGRCPRRALANVAAGPGETLADTLKLLLQSPN